MSGSISSSSSIDEGSDGRDGSKERVKLEGKQNQHQTTSQRSGNQRTLNGNGISHQTDSKQNRSSAAAIAYSRALRSVASSSPGVPSTSASTSHANSSFIAVNPLDDPPPLYGQHYMSTRINMNTDCSSTGISSWNQSSSTHRHQQQQQQHQYQTLDRRISESNNVAKLNHQLLRNNLLSSSVRDLLMSTLSHDSARNHTQMQNYSALNPRNDYDATTASTASTNGNPSSCLVRTQSGSRFIFPTEMIETTTTSLVDHHTGMMMRGGCSMNSTAGASGTGITTSRTFGSKLNHRRHIGGASSTLHSIQSRFSKSLNMNINWRLTSIILFIVSVTLFFSLIYTLAKVSECSCNSMMIEDGDMSSSSSSRSSSHNGITSSGSTDSSSNSHASMTGASVSISCPVLCSGRGQYVRGSCVCNPGWKGKECHVPYNHCDPPDCSGRGSCKNGNCACRHGFHGPGCEFTLTQQQQLFQPLNNNIHNNNSSTSCPILCSNRGRYVLGSCVCDDGWKGKECNIRYDECESANCNSHGTCVEGECLCKSGWKGPACDQKSSECQVPDCNGRGTCRSGMCECRSGFKGIHCEIRDCIDPSCSGHGSCFEGRCICKAGWMGSNCSMADPRFLKHFPNCSNGRGVFDIETDRCSCFPGYSGHECEIDKCDIDCSPHGSCEGSVCVCSPGWIGDRCQIKSCDERCSSNGRCNNGTCECNVGFYGKHCSIEGCPGNCSGPDHGECVKNIADSSSSSEFEWSSGDYVCRCRPGWTGLDCSHRLELNCNDNLDNDDDGLIDCADSECCSRPECRDSLMCLTSPEPLDILLRKPPPSVTSSFYQKMKFLIDEGSVQSYAHRDEYSER